MWFKKGKNKFYFDSYGVQPPSNIYSHQYFTKEN